MNRGELKVGKYYKIKSDHKLYSETFIGKLLEIHKNGIIKFKTFNNGQFWWTYPQYVTEEILEHEIPFEVLKEWEK